MKLNYIICIIAICGLLVYTIWFFVRFKLRIATLNKKSDECAEKLRDDGYENYCSELIDAELLVEYNKLTDNFEKGNHTLHEIEGLTIGCKLGFVEKEIGKRSMLIPK